MALKFDVAQQVPCPGLETALQEHEERVDSLLKDANKYLGALKTWKKACQSGPLANRQKAAAQAAELAEGLPEAARGTAAAWGFDTRAYLEGDAWREEVQTTAAERLGLRVLAEGDNLISSPVVVRTLPGRGALQIGKVNWPSLRPRIVAAELKRLRDRASSANSQEFVDSLSGAAERLTREGDPVVKFRDIYDLFSLTPGWKKDTPPRGVRPINLRPTPIRDPCHARRTLLRDRLPIRQHQRAGRLFGDRRRRQCPALLRHPVPVETKGEKAWHSPIGCRIDD